jgi:polyhydroxyalkanoate synthesis regulator phasin
VRRCLPIADIAGVERFPKVSEAFQSYINMVTGVSKSTQAKASATARALFRQAGLEEVAVEASERVTKLAEEIMNASRINRELLQNFVVTEVDKAAGRLGFARADEVQALRAEVASLRAQVEAAAAAAPTAARSAPAKKAAAKKAAARKSSTPTTPTKKATAAKSAGRQPRKKAAAAKRSAQSGGK